MHGEANNREEERDFGALDHRGKVLLTTLSLPD